MTQRPLPAIQTISSKGQITIRKRLLDWLGVRAGDKVRLSAVRGNLLISREPVEPDPRLGLGRREPDHPGGPR